jgi:hypothetical protein
MSTPLTPAEREDSNCQGLLDSSKRCITCKDPAIYHPEEGVWRHKNEGFEGGQFLCDKACYPVNVEDESPVEAATEASRRRDEILAEKDAEIARLRTLVSGLSAVNGDEDNPSVEVCAAIAQRDAELVTLRTEKAGGNDERN